MNRTALRLRLLEPADVSALADLWVAAWQEEMPAIDFATRRDWIVEFLQADAPARETTVILDNNGEPCGFATVERGYLHQLAVAPPAKGQGVATALLAAAKAAAPDGLRLDVNQASTRAVRFYEREGFVRENAGTNATSGLATWRMFWKSEETIVRD